MDLSAGSPRLLQWTLFAVGVVVCRVLTALGMSGTQLKWPNDVLVEGKKIGGILIELMGDVTGDCTVVVGLGLNVHSWGLAKTTIDQPWTALDKYVPFSNRNQLLASLLDQLTELMAVFSDRGFVCYRNEWNQRNAFAGLVVDVASADRMVSGLMLEVDERGALVLDVNGKRQVLTGGELSLRVADASTD